MEPQRPGPPADLHDVFRRTAAPATVDERSVESVYDLRLAQRGGVHEEPIPVRVQEVFTFGADQSDFELSPEFRQALEKSPNPLVVTILGNSRVGKTERLNQLVTRTLLGKGPFLSNEGAEPVTKTFQFCGPIQFAELARLHKLDLTSEMDPDIFLIDCEGLHSLAATRPGLKRATFALAQISTLPVLVVHGMLNHDNISSARSLFVLSQAFIPDALRLRVGTVCMMRDVGVRGGSGDVAVRDRGRQEQDRQQTDRVISVLNDNRLRFDSRNFQVLAQPTFEDQELYWKSIDDFLVFMRYQADTRKRIPGAFLCGLFDTAKPAITKMSDFETSNIPLEAIIDSHIRYKLESARHSAM
jgi:hypothetical protein